LNVNLAMSKEAFHASLNNLTANDQRRFTVYNETMPLV
jgi:hypothetical protein